MSNSEFNAFDTLRDDIQAVFAAAAAIARDTKNCVLSHKPPLRVLFRAARAGHGIRTLQHVTFLMRANAALEYFATDFYNNLDRSTRGLGYEDHHAFKLPGWLNAEKWYAMVNDYVEFMQKHDIQKLREVLCAEFGLDMASFDDPDANVEMQADPQEQHAAGYYGFLKELPGWKKIEALLEHTNINVEMIYDPGKDGASMIMIGFFTKDERPLSTSAWHLVRDHQISPSTQP